MSELQKYYLIFSLQLSVNNSLGRINHIQFLTTKRAIDYESSSLHFIVTILTIAERGVGDIGENFERQQTGSRIAIRHQTSYDGTHLFVLSLIKRTWHKASDSSANTKIIVNARCYDRVRLFGIRVHGVALVSASYQSNQSLCTPSRA
jgi:hypothetical protein